METKQLLGVLLAALVVVSVFAGPGAGAAGTITVDTETTDTASTSEISSGSNVTEFNANASNSTTVELESDSNDSKVELFRENGSHIAAVNTTGVVVAHNASGAENSYLNHTFSHDELADVERGIESNVTMTAKMYNNTTNASPATANFTWFIETDNSSTVQNIDDSDVSSGSIVTVVNESGVFGTSFFGDDETEIETNQRSVNGTDTDVVLVFSNSSVADDFAAAAEGENAGEKLSGFSLTRTVALVSADDGTTVPAPVFVDSVPDDFDTDRTHALYVTNHGGENALVVHAGSEFDNPTSLSVHAIGGAGLTAFADDYTTARLSNMIPGTITIGALALTPFVAIPRRRRKRRTGDEQARDDVIAAANDRDADGDSDGDQQGAGAGPVPSSPATPQRPPATAGRDGASAAPRDRGGV